MISNSGHDENGRYTGGAAGDQTGEEWAIRTWYNRPWTHCIRHPDRSIGDTIAEMAIQAAANDRIGYDQDERYTFWDALKECGYWPKNINRNVEADCSAGVAAIVKAAGYIRGNEKLKAVNADAYTGNLRSVLKNAGFEVLTESKYLNSDQYLYNGDILLYEGHHTCVNVSDGAKVTRGTANKGIQINYIDQLELRKRTATIVDTARREHWQYGDNHGLCWETHVISCDRLPMQALYDLGVKDQRQGLETVCTMDTFLPLRGFSRILSASHLTHGDIVLFKYDGSPALDWRSHAFLLDQWHGKQKIYKYDHGSQQRIETPQPFVTVLDEWPDRTFYAGYRVPRKDAGIPDGWYKIETALGSGFVMDVSGGSVEKKANIQLYKDNGTQAQKFYVENMGNGLYRIKNMKSGLVFDIDNASRFKAGNLQQYKPNNTDAQLFFITQGTKNGYCFIQNRNSGLVLDVADAKKEKRTNVRQWSLNNTDAQMWKFVPVEV